MEWRTNINNQLPLEHFLALGRTWPLILSCSRPACIVYRGAIKFLAVVIYVARWISSRNHRRRPEPILRILWSCSFVTFTWVSLHPAAIIIFCDQESDRAQGRAPACRPRKGASRASLHQLLCDENGSAQAVRWVACRHDTPSGPISRSYI